MRPKQLISLFVLICILVSCVACGKDFRPTVPNLTGAQAARDLVNETRKETDTKLYFDSSWSLRGFMTAIETPNNMNEAAQLYTVIVDLLNRFNGKHEMKHISLTEEKWVDFPNDSAFATVVNPREVLAAISDGDRNAVLEWRRFFELAYDLDKSLTTKLVEGIPTHAPAAQLKRHEDYARVIKDPSKEFYTFENLPPYEFELPAQEDPNNKLTVVITDLAERADVNKALAKSVYAAVQNDRGLDYSALFCCFDLNYTGLTTYYPAGHYSEANGRSVNKWIDNERMPLYCIVVGATSDVIALKDKLEQSLDFLPEDTYRITGIYHNRGLMAADPEAILFDPFIADRGSEELFEGEDTLFNQNFRMETPRNFFDDPPAAYPGKCFLLDTEYIAGKDPAKISFMVPLEGLVDGTPATETTYGAEIAEVWYAYEGETEEVELTEPPTAPPPDEEADDAADEDDEDEKEKKKDRDIETVEQTAWTPLDEDSFIQYVKSKDCFIRVETRLIPAGTEAPVYTVSDEAFFDLHTTLEKEQFLLNDTAEPDAAHDRLLVTVSFPETEEMQEYDYLALRLKVFADRTVSEVNEAWSWILRHDRGSSWDKASYTEYQTAYGLESIFETLSGFQLSQATKEANDLLARRTVADLEFTLDMRNETYQEDDE